MLCGFCLHTRLYCCRSTWWYCICQKGSGDCLSSCELKGQWVPISITLRLHLLYGDVTSADGSIHCWSLPNFFLTCCGSLPCVTCSDILKQLSCLHLHKSAYRHYWGYLVHFLIVEDFHMPPAYPTHDNATSNIKILQFSLILGKELTTFYMCNFATVSSQSLHMWFESVNCSLETII